MLAPNHSALDLLDLPYALGQRGLLTPEEFIKAAEERGLRLQLGHLEALHRSGHLVPLLRLRRAEATVVDPWGSGRLIVPRPDTSQGALLAARSAGRLSAPSPMDFTPWSRDYVVRGAQRLRVHEYLYSPWQTLAFDEASTLMPSIRQRGQAAFGARFAVTSDVFMSTRMTSEVTVTLSVLEPIYYPDLVGSVRYAGAIDEDRQTWVNDYLAWIHDRDPTSVLTWLGATEEEIVNLADGLVTRTAFFDPIRDWVDLIRLFAPEKWEKATGAVRLALDHRIAAEMLYQLRDDLATSGAADPLPVPPAFAWTPQAERFNRPYGELDRVLTDFGVSPHPSLVMALEGDTEMVAVRSAMEHLHVPTRRNYIELFNMGGNTKDYSLLASYVVTPELGRQLGTDFVMLDRPITRFLIVTDPENSLASTTGRTTYKRQVVDAIFSKLPSEYQTAQARTELEGLVTIETWTGTESFEFAHFTDFEIVTAIKKVYRGAGRPVPSVSAADVAAIRRRRGNLKALLRSLPAPAIDKVALQEALWPALRRRLDRNVNRKMIQAVPIGRILQVAVDSASMSFRRSVGLRV